MSEGKHADASSDSGIIIGAIILGCLIYSGLVHMGHDISGWSKGHDSEHEPEASTGTGAP